jgi:membrane-associated phospholipid phosphatase
MTRATADTQTPVRGAAALPPATSEVAARVRRLRVPAVAVYLVLSAVVVAADGAVPSRPYVLFWVLGLVIILGWHNPSPVARFAMDWLPVLVIAACYDLVRSRAPSLVPRAVTAPQRDFDEAVFGGTVPTVWLQDLLVDRGSPHWWDYPAWLMYLSHFVVTPAVAVWLYLRHRDWFHRYAILILTVSVCGFVTYFIIPAVPPWLASRNGALEPTTRVVHSVWASIGFDRAAQVFNGDARLANPVAALPSLHAAWPFITLLFLWRRIGRWRWLLLAYNAAMVFVLVYGAEHYVSDILLGWLYATVVFVVVTLLLDRRDEHRAATTAAAAAAT